jgi:[acyl-carrier-protein] S-malonyltransferase
MKTALLFSGQATQYVGMGRHLYDNYPASRAVFEAANDILGESLSTLIFEGPDSELNLTVNTQPAVLTVALAAWALLTERGFKPSVVAGHSLGEYAALVSAGVLSFEDALKVCKRRGELMQTAVPQGHGAMIIVQRLEAEFIRTVCRDVEGYADISVYNAPKLVAVSGEKAAIERVTEKLIEARGIVRPLAVSAPFHCELLTPAAKGLGLALADISLSALEVPYINNVDAQWIESASAETIKHNLVRQVVSPVRWEESIALMMSKGIERFWHLGPGRSNLTHVKKQNRKANVLSFDEANAVSELLEGNLD